MEKILFIEEPNYGVEDKVFELTRMSLNKKETSSINDLLSKFDDEEMELINQVCQIHFKIGFRNAIELLNN